MDTAPQIPKIAEKAEVQILAGPFVNREHVTVAVVEAASSEALDQFIAESRLAQWNRVRILPSVPVQEGIVEVSETPSLF